MKWDVFVSHASEDKELVARPLSLALRKLGLRVWYDEFELKIGDSLSESIDRGLANSSFGVVVVSKAFLSKNWTKHELRGLTAALVAKRTRILPIWHRVNLDDVLTVSPTLADLFSEGTDKPIDVVAMSVLDTIRPELHQSIMRKVAVDESKSAVTLEIVDFSKIEISSVRHAVLPKPFVRRIKFVRHILREVYPRTLDEWIEGFQRDSRPTDELVIWESISERYLNVMDGYNFSLSEKKSLFKLLLYSSMTTKFDIENILKEMSKRLVKQVEKAFDKPAAFAPLDGENHLDDYHLGRGLIMA